VLDIEGGNRAAGTKLIMWDQGNGDNQQWYEDKNGLLRSKLHDFVPDGSTPGISNLFTSRRVDRGYMLQISLFFT